MFEPGGSVVMVVPVGTPRGANEPEYARFTCAFEATVCVPAIVTFPRFEPRYEATNWPGVKIWFPAIFAVKGAVPVMVTGLPDIVVYWGTVVVAVLARPVYERPRMGATFETTARDPRAEIAGFRVTVSPSTKPFVLATVRFSGFADVDAVVTFDAVP
jgi:hypothetical protein